MKHGDKAKANTAKAKAKASGKKSGAESGKKSGLKAGASIKAQKSSGSAKESSGKKAGTQSSQTSKAPGNGKPKARAVGSLSEPGFNNPTVGTAFKRAIKKYPVAFRRLTD